jgi:hypothetical protein
MISEAQLREETRMAAFKAGSQKVMAASIGISEAAFSLFASGARKPSKNILDALGYKAVTMYQKQQDS